MSIITEKVIERFHTKYRVNPETGCWEWINPPSSTGYTNISIDGKVYGAHRISWQIYNGAIPDGLYICHTCDNTRCVNPNHLFLGTPQDNARDRDTKGRMGKRRDPLTDREIEEILAMRDGGEYVKDIAEKFGVHQTTVFRILRKKMVNRS